MFRAERNPSTGRLRARATGVVVGFVLYGRIAEAIAAALPSVGKADRTTFTHNVTSGDLSGAGHAFASADDLHAIALASFGSGYEALLFSGAGLTAIAAIAT